MISSMRFMCLKQFGMRQERSALRATHFGGLTFFGLRISVQIDTNKRPILLGSV